MSTEDKDRLFDAMVGFLNVIEDPEEKEKTARAFRVQLGTASRFMSYRKGWIFRFWNWFIDAEYTSMVFAPWVWTIFWLCVAFLLSFIPLYLVLKGQN